MNSNRIIAFFLFAIIFIILATTPGYATSNLVYVVLYDGSVSIIDAGTNGVITNYNVGTPASLFDVVANPSGSKAYVSVSGDLDKISIISPTTSQVQGSIFVGDPAGMAITSDGTKMYVCMVDDDKVAILDLRTNTVAGYITVGDYPIACVLTPDNSKLYVACYNDTGNDMVQIISTSTNTVDTYLAYGVVGGSGACDFAFSKDGSKIFVLSDNKYDSNGRIDVWATSNNAWISTISMDHKSWLGGMDIEPDGSHIWVCDYDDFSITAYDAATYAKYKEVGFTPTTDGTLDIRIADNNIMYVAQENLIHVYNLNSETITANITMGADVRRIEVFTPAELSNTYITFTAKTLYETLAVADLNVSVYDETGSLLYTGVTDSTGNVVFLLSSDEKYRLLFNQSPSVNTWYNITPASSAYIVDIPFTDVIGLTSWSDTIYNPPGEEISWSLITTFNSTTGAGTMNATYMDTGAVTGVTFSFYQNGSGLGSADTFVNNQTPAESSDSWTATESLASAAGKSYYYVITVVKPTGTYVYYSGLAYTFPGPQVLAGVFPVDWYFWIGFGVCMCFYGVGTVSKKGVFAIFGAVAGIIMCKWGWYSLVFPDIIAYPAIAFTFIVAIIVIIVEKEKFG